MGDCFGNSTLALSQGGALQENASLVVIALGAVILLILMSCVFYWRIRKARAEQNRLSNLLQQYQAPLVDNEDPQDDDNDVAAAAVMLQDLDSSDKPDPEVQFNN